MSRARTAVALGGTALVIGAGAAFAAASIPSDDGTFRACYAPAIGIPRFVDEGQACRRGERLATWSQRGPRGATGARGPAGPPGPPGPPGPAGGGGATGHQAQQADPVTAQPGVSATVLELSLPTAGTYRVTMRADVRVETLRGGGADATPVCDQSNPGGVAFSVDSVAPGGAATQIDRFGTFMGFAPDLFDATQRTCFGVRQWNDSRIISIPGPRTIRVQAAGALPSANTVSTIDETVIGAETLAGATGAIPG